MWGGVFEEEGSQIDRFWSGRRFSFFSPLNLDLQKLSPHQIQQTVARITDVCWDTCLPGTPGRSLSSKEQACVSECAKRFIEATQFVIARFQARAREDAASGGGGDF